MDQCQTIINDAGIDANKYPMAVAHGIHSLNLESARHFFKPEATENNKIPTASTNLSAANPVLDHVSLAGYDTTLKRYFNQIWVNWGPVLSLVDETGLMKSVGAMSLGQNMFVSSLRKDKC